MLVKYMTVSAKTWLICSMAMGNEPADISMQGLSEVALADGSGGSFGLSAGSSGVPSKGSEGLLFWCSGDSII